MSDNPNVIDTATYSQKLRDKTWRPQTSELLVARLKDSDQEADLSEPPNCGGLGRLRHFSRQTNLGWPDNPLPIEPAEHFLGRVLGDAAVSQVFQNLACNWRCWYCYVPFNLLGGNAGRGEFVTASDLVQRHFETEDPPPIIDISGGQPDLVPEWTLETLRAVEDNVRSSDTYVWTDDNLSTTYLWDFLDESEISWMSSQPNHGRVGCFKGFDEESFTFNTRAAPQLFDFQFEVFKRLLGEGFDLYGYVTLTSPGSDKIEQGVTDLVNRLQRIHVNLPLRVIPLEIGIYGPVESRLNPVAQESLVNQQAAIEAWNTQIEARFGAEERLQPIWMVDIRGR